jgi:hypothetical protein
VAADERDVAIEDHDLAMVALMKDADVADVVRVELHNLAAGRLHLTFDRIAHLLRADRVEQHAHLQPGLGTLGQGVRDALGQDGLLPQERLEVHRVPSLADLLDQHVEERAVLEYLDRVAVDRRGQREPASDGTSLSIGESMPQCKLDR